jgi:hypothetical protein
LKSYLDRAARQVAEDEVGRAITGETSPLHSLTRQGRLYRARWIGPWQCAWSPAKTVRRLSSARALDSTWLLALPIAADVASKFSTTTYRSGQPDIARRQITSARSCSSGSTSPVAEPYSPIQDFARPFVSNWPERCRSGFAGDCHLRVNTRKPK